MCLCGSASVGEQETKRAQQRDEEPWMINPMSIGESVCVCLRSGGNRREYWGTARHMTNHSACLRVRGKCVTLTWLSAYSCRGDDR